MELRDKKIVLKIKNQWFQTYSFVHGVFFEMLDIISVNSSSWNRVILHKKSEDGQGRWRSSLY